MRIFTIGYEATTMAEFIAALRKAGVERVIDVRALPLSRRPGFSKNVLAASLKDAGIDYVLLKNLGTPKPGRDAAKKGDVATLERVYETQLGLPEAQAEAAQMRARRGEAQRAGLLRAQPRTLPPHPAARGRGRGRRNRRPVSLKGPFP